MPDIKGIVSLPVDALTTNGNVRVDAQASPSLVASIKELGIIQPLVVRNTSDGWVVLAGHRRLSAALEANLTDVPVHVIIGKKVEDVDRIAMQYAENVERVDLTDWEKAQVAWDLKLEGLTQPEVASVMGIATKDVSKLQKVVKELTKDEHLDPVVAGQFQLDGLIEMADSSIPEHASEVMLGVTGGEHRWLHSAIRSVELEVATLEFYEENKEQLAEWGEAGVQVTQQTPQHHWGKTTSYGAKDDPKVATLEDIGIPVGKHIKLDCHMVYLQVGYSVPKLSHWCMDRRVHAEKGKSKVKAKNQDVVTAAGADPKASAERAAVKAAKDLRRAKAAQWMAARYTKADMYQLALFSALSGDGWKEDHIRAATWMLGFNPERPKGADYSWYTNRLNTYLDDEFGDLEDGDKRREWKIRMVHARRYIDDFWPIDMVKEQIGAIEVTDAT
jgi:hypothetical protein